MYKANILLNETDDIATSQYFNALHQ